MKYPIGIQNFQSLIEDGYAYVDKTALVWELANKGRYYFLSRPRRFGKSLLVSTLKAYFEGKRELFKGLAIEKLETEWKSYPVLHIDLNASQYDTGQHLLDTLNIFLTEWEKEYGSEPQEVLPSHRFAGIIRRAYQKTGKKVVILVDEYDKPLALNLTNEDLCDQYRSILKAFYGVMKSSDEYIRMGFLTGVTKFSKVSVFSDLNNISDISMLPQYVEICGMTEQEIRDNFDSEVEALAEANNLTKDECYAKLRRRYDGYHFRQDSPGMYNPYSLINTLSNRVFQDYWFASGTPTVRVNLLKDMEYNLNDIENEPVTSQLLGSVDTIKVNPLPVIYQSGYLTIKSYDEQFQEYHLGFPNEEVESGFINFLMPMYTNAQYGSSRFSISRFIRELSAGDVEGFMTRLESLMSDTDYRVVGKAELYVQNVMFLLFRLLGFYVEVEHATSNGRTDMIIKTNDYIYIIELKIDKSADEALRQIEDKGYAKPYATDSRTLFKIGISFSSEKRCITEWKIM